MLGHCCRLCEEWMALHLGQRGSPSCDIWKARILGRRALFEVSKMCDSNLLGEAQKFPVAGTNLVNSVAIVRNRKAPTQSKELLPVIILGIEISRLAGYQ